VRTSRVEAFSDGVFAIAITLLVLNLQVPVRGSTRHLWSALGHAWPSYAAYAVSFLIIGIVWTNHHTVLDAVERVDKPLVVINLILLMFVVIVPYTTSLLAEYLTAGANGRIAAAVYGAGMLGQAITWQALWGYIVTHESLHAPSVDPVKARTSMRRFAVGVPVYATATGIAFVNAYLALGAHALVAALYLRGRIDVQRLVPE
jgi:uncharacterized membrane protein